LATHNGFLDYPNSWPSAVSIIEVGPRDGLQREERPISTDEKVELIEKLVAAGLKQIQVTSFVHPKYVPQMADAEEVCARIPRRDDIVYSGLALNLRGVERALIVGLSKVDISVSANEDHSQRNANRTIAEALMEFREMYKLAREGGMLVRGGIQCAFGYQRADDVEKEDVIAIARHHLNLGVDELALADSAGFGNPREINSLIMRVKEIAGDTPLVLHLHDTRGMGLANVLSGANSGISHFDTAFGGLGGCPFIDGASGNIATEDTVYMLEEMGIETGVNLGKVSRISREYEEKLGRALPGKLHQLLN
jgi:hydroxymethylglutaryl-CoA lyase